MLFIKNSRAQTKWVFKLMNEQMQQVSTKANLVWIFLWPEFSFARFLFGNNFKRGTKKKNFWKLLCLHLLICISDISSLSWHPPYGAIYNLAICRVSFSYCFSMKIVLYFKLKNFLQFAFFLCFLGVEKLFFIFSLSIKRSDVWQLHLAILPSISNILPVP